jgi:hypothetical protein
VLFTGRSYVEATDCFISMFAEKKSHANYFIRKANIDKDKFIDFIKKEGLMDNDEEESVQVTSQSQLEKIIIIELICVCVYGFIIDINKNSSNRNKKTKMCLLKYI